MLHFSLNSDGTSVKKNGMAIFLLKDTLIIYHTSYGNAIGVIKPFKKNTLTLEYDVHIVNRHV